LLAFRGLESSQIHLGPYPLLLFVFGLFLLQRVLFFFHFFRFLRFVLTPYPFLVFIVHEFDILVVWDSLPLGLSLVVADLNSVLLI
jgi:hypothetical protein